jgi:hypothetical protein
MCSDNWNAREGVRLSIYCSRSVLLLPRYATETGDGGTADTVAHIVTQYQNRFAPDAYMCPKHLSARAQVLRNGYICLHLRNYSTVNMHLDGRLPFVVVADCSTLTTLHAH